MSRLIKIAFLCAGLYFSWQRYSAHQAFEARVAEFPDIEIYTTPQCGYCKMAIAYMDKHDIEYVQKDIEYGADLKDEYRERGGNGVPYFFVHGEPMRGWNAERFEKLRGGS